MDPVWEVLFRAGIANYTNITQKSGELPKYSHSLILLEMDTTFVPKYCSKPSKSIPELSFPLVTLTLILIINEICYFREWGLDHNFFSK